MLNDYGRFSSVTSMLDQLSWTTLQTRSKVTRLHILHKNVFYRQLSLTIPPYYLPEHNQRDSIIHYIISYLIYLVWHTKIAIIVYSSRMISDWNLLPIHLV